LKKREGKEVKTMAQETTLKVPAIHCESCVKTITGTLNALPTVEVTEADTETKLVRVKFDESAVSVDQIRETLDEAGFSAED
jgi:copper chaperone CopZ